MMRGGAAGTIKGCGGSTATRACVETHAEVSVEANATTRQARPRGGTVSNVLRIVSRQRSPRTVGPEVACGNSMRKVVPVPGVDCTSTSPSCNWMVRNTIDSPMPLPPAFVVKYRSKMRGSCVGGIPTPVSSIVSATLRPLAGSADSRNVPPLGIA